MIRNAPAGARPTPQNRSRSNPHDLERSRENYSGDLEPTPMIWNAPEGARLTPQNRSKSNPHDLERSRENYPCYPERSPIIRNAPEGARPTPQNRSRSNPLNLHARSPRVNTSKIRNFKLKPKTKPQTHPHENALKVKTHAPLCFLTTAMGNAWSHHCCKRFGCRPTARSAFKLSLQRFPTIMFGQTIRLL